MEEISSLILYKQVRKEIKPLYDHEADSIALLVVEDLTGFTPTEIITGRHWLNSHKTQETISRQIRLLKDGVPVQYVLGKAHFYGHQFSVDSNTLIPRPETEELVKHVESFIYKNNLKQASILDIGTGSGCIAISLALEDPEFEVVAIDVSKNALKIAEHNAYKLGATIKFINADMATYSTNKKYDIIVSNPPYVTESERKNLRKNVLEHEPHSALFVKDEDPLLYYRYILELSKKSLKSRGGLFMEINELYGLEIEELMTANGYTNTKIAKDINGKDRFAIGISL